MLEFLVLIITLLFWAIKGIFKFAWLIVSFPFNLINDIRKKRKRRNDEIRKQNKVEEKIENLFQKIKDDIFINGTSNLPDSILVYNNFIEIKYNFNQTKTIYYKNYVSDNLDGYYTYWDSNDSREQADFNEPRMLAEKINTMVNNAYNIYNHMKENVDKYSGLTVCRNTQEYVVMYKKQ